ncbi:MAG: hypothetical protein KGL01_00480 [Betaproteobacteria bacterium]|nr:hypothetical protein [Betaproteobacteria bacterium]
MFGLIVFGLLGIYLLLLAWATRRGWRWGVEKKGWTGRKRYLGAVIGFLIVYLPVFWDFIPTLVVHQYYCAKDSGFWVYKTLDQWKAENPGVMEGLHQILQPNQRMPYSDLSILDERFAIETHRREPVPLLSTQIAERLLVDRKTGEVLAKGVDVGSGYGNLAVGAESLHAYKFWLSIKPCRADGIWNLSTKLQNMRGTK